MSLYVDTFKRGIVEMLALRYLCETDAHGYQISKAIRQRTHGLVTMKEGAFYPLLYRLEQSGYTTSRTESLKSGTPNDRIRIIYHITPSGRKYLEDMKSDYDLVHSTVVSFFNWEGPHDE